MDKAYRGFRAGFILFALAALFFADFPACAEEKSAPASADLKARIAKARNAVSATNVVRDTLGGECRPYEYYESFVADANDLLKSGAYKDKELLYYALARARLKQLMCLSKQNDLESGRLYMSVNDNYYSEALEYLNMASGSGTQRLAADTALLKFVIANQKTQTPQAATEALDGLVDSIAAYSQDRSRKTAEFYRIVGELDDMGLPDLSTRLKIEYAKKVDSGLGREIFGQILKKGDQALDAGDVKEATAYYSRYLNNAREFMPKDEMAASIIRLGEKYYSIGRYKEARAYYQSYLDEYNDPKFVDYCAYKLALCYYYENDYSRALATVNDFLEKHPDSVWFEKAFELGCRIYYEKFKKDEAIAGLQGLADKYYRKNTGDYSILLIALLEYRMKNYDKSLAILKKIDPSGVYSFAANTLKDDIAQIKKGAGASFGTESEDFYRMWQPGSQPNLKLEASSLEVDKGKSVLISVLGLQDDDKFSEYQIDREDISRLPKKLAESTEKDLLIIQWSSQGGSFSDNSQGTQKSWQAPAEPGTYTVTFFTDDLGLIRFPSRGQRKDGAKEDSLVITVR